MVLYGVTLVPLAEELFTAAPDLLVPIYLNDSAFYGLVNRSARLITLLLEQGTERGYFPEPTKALFICDSPSQEEASNQTLEAEGLRVNMVPGI